MKGRKSQENLNNNKNTKSSTNLFAKMDFKEDNKIGN